MVKHLLGSDCAHMLRWPPDCQGFFWVFFLDWVLLLYLFYFLLFFSFFFSPLFIALCNFSPFLFAFSCSFDCLCLCKTPGYFLAACVCFGLAVFSPFCFFFFFVSLPASFLSFFSFFFCLRKIVTSVSLQVYIDDLLGERVWVDREDCKGFVDNILTAFTTKAPPKHLMVGTDAGTLSSLTPGGGQ